MYYILVGFFVGALVGLLISLSLHYGSGAPCRCRGVLVCGDTRFLVLAFGACGIFVSAVLF